MRIIRLYFLIVILCSLSVQGCSPSRGVYHTVQPGQTLYSIGRTYGVNEKNLARINGIENPRQMKAGEKIFIPGVSQRKYVSSSSATDGTSGAKKPVAQSRPAVKQKKPAATAQPPPRVVTKTTSGPAALRGSLAWPVRGKILKKFGQKSSGPSKGLEISTDKGTYINSAAAGRVIYSGDGIRGYGNLIILKHDSGLFTVYGYNDRNLVKNGSFVGKGERIASAGVPPGGGAPRLYFEVRKGKTAVDPLFYLP